MTLAPTVIHGALRAYDWGMVDGLAKWSGVHTSEAQAELWFGAHPAAPSPVADIHGSTLLDEWPDYQVPLLTKILAAATPLSLQVHPDAATIDRWLLDPGSAALLADRGEKTEMLIALEPFTVLLGWRPAAVAARLMEIIGADRGVVASLSAGQFAPAVAALLGRAPVRATADEWTHAVLDAGLDDTAVLAMSAVVDRFDDQAGVAVAALMQSSILAPGDAAYVPAGVPHAYVSGLGIEVMNSSDNVVRLGLTSKTMSVPHALDALVAERRPQVLTAPADGVYAPVGAPFRVAMVSDGHCYAPEGRYRLVLAVDRTSEVEIGGDAFAVCRGDALAIPPASGPARVRTAGRAVVVTAAGEAV